MRDILQSSLQVVEHDAAALAPRGHMFVDVYSLPRVDLPDAMLRAIVTVPDEQHSMVARRKGIEVLNTSPVSKPIDVSNPHRFFGDLRCILEELRRLKLQLCWQPMIQTLIIKPLPVDEHLVLETTVHVVHET